MIHLKRILLPTDFSDFAAAATKYACELAATFEADLHVLHVLEAHAWAPDIIARYLPEAPTREHRTAAAESLLAGVLDAKWAEGRTVVNVVAEGSPFLEIVRYAKREEIDLIVLGTHGRSGLAHALMGSVAENVARNGPCPVLTVRPEGHQFVMP